VDPEISLGSPTTPETRAKDLHARPFAEPVKFWAILAFLLLLVPLICAFGTGQVWEDFLITFKFSENLCAGHGLVYVPGRIVHGFTSPLGTLLPALCHLAPGGESYLGALWWFRLAFCLPAYVAGGMLLAYAVGLAFPGRRWPQLLVVAIYALDAKSALFTMNGMETGLMLAFLAYAFASAHTPLGGPRSWWHVGLAWGGLMWTRPDACLAIAALGMSMLVFRHGETLSAKIRETVKSALLTTALYLPWFAWAWWYYGSPIPHTILAKSQMIPYDGIGDYLACLAADLPSRLAWVFGAPYARLREWPRIFTLWWQATALFCCLYGLFKGGEVIGRAAALVYACLLAYLILIPFPYPWYYPPVAQMGAIILVCGLVRLASIPGRAGRWIFSGITASLLGAAFATLILSAYAATIQQVVVEDKTRTQIGLWLKENGSPRDRVYIECLGYVGYFSGMDMHDYPGLVSPDVVSLRQKGETFYTIPLCLRPEWVVLRRQEAMNMQVANPAFFSLYQPVVFLDTSEDVKRFGAFLGRGGVLNDATFVIFRRNTDS
jgi:hypothetical protein